MSRPTGGNRRWRIPVQFPLFFTTAVQHRSLREGPSLASRLQQHAKSREYSAQADGVLCFMRSFWDPRWCIYVANTGDGRSGLDSNTVVASIHTFDPTAGCDPVTFQPCSDRALANLKKYVDSFRRVYPLNRGTGATDPVATGRYPEDVYFGGNPWYLTTLAVAEQLYDAFLTWDTFRAIEVTPISQAFFAQFVPSITPGTYHANSDSDSDSELLTSSTTYSRLSAAIRAYADGEEAIVARHTLTDGGLAERFDKASGTPVSAADLSWSYAAAFRARKGGSGGAWGTKSLELIC